ncbi:MAG: hypothetical protein M0D55_18265 [Elusimicrobiota bacterium]|nr:MAG: hypothetical protein M0D55_18265 [Elusimicrobiota bacterium]
MVNRTALALLLLTAAAPSWGDAIADAQRLSGGSNVRAFDGGTVRTGDATGDERILRASDGALTTGGLFVATDKGSRAPVVAEVPAPSLTKDEKGAKDKPGFFSKLMSGKGLLYGAGGALAGAGIGWLVGGPIGAVIGGLLGAVGGFFLSKLLAK